VNLTWHFPLANRGNALGSSGSGVDQFSDNPFGNLSREIIQNSIDAKQSNKKAIVQFHYFQRNIEDFPAIHSFFDYLIKWQKHHLNANTVDEKEKIFVERAIRALNISSNNKMSWLRISDFNTKGLIGASDINNQNTPWFAFINGTGKNQKENRLSGGSKGLGKNSIFANSLFQTMFVSSYTEQNERASMGVAKLISLVISDNTERPDWTQGVGFCIEDEEKAIKYVYPTNKLMNIDPNFERESNGFGTDIYVPGFLYDEEWKAEIISEAIISFMPAILAGELEIRVSDYYDKTHIIDEFSIADAVDNSLFFNKESRKKEAKQIYQTLTSDNKMIYENKDKPGFEMRLFLLQDELNATNYIYCYRLPTKMKIERRTANAQVNFTGVLLVYGEELAKRLRAIEDATHSKWSRTKWKDTPYSQSEIEEALKIVSNFVDEKCSIFGIGQEDEESDFDWAKNQGWVSEESVESLSGKKERDLGLPTKEVMFRFGDDPTTHKKRKPLKPKNNVISNDGNASSWVLGSGSLVASDTEGSFPDGHNQGGEGSYHPSSQIEEVQESEESGRKLMIRKTVTTADCRMPAVCPEDGRFTLLFTPTKTGENAEIEIFISGIAGDSEPAFIKSAKQDEQEVEYRKNVIYMPRIERNKEYRINLIFEETQNYIWEVNISADE